MKQIMVESNKQNKRQNVQGKIQGQYRTMTPPSDAGDYFKDEPLSAATVKLDDDAGRLVADGPQGAELDQQLRQEDFLVEQ